ncbi:hypothetical protein LNKW23_40910 [Paralimibaculum aggregatum]|uniref:Sulfotransferase domain-containing protein n=1 Tax=Paralimibaculum aggregatum TaxID=3036245 RepID=A0ABQ6LQJ2_9RHOB|nr:tetratricopeptide repeat protein [Limibaculum sp. NKW23]GMG84875.1 hypothetical protein LNKW23_40910 [Limibaculum sp. NKW23]
MPKAILHIGTEKTGTSTLQIFFQLNRERLNANGFHYPAFAGNTNQIRLAAYGQEDREFDDLRIDLGIEDAAGLAAFRARMEREAAEEVAAHPDKTFIMSNEHLSSRLNGPPSVARLKRLLAPLFEEIEVVVYLRRQDQVAVSLYSTLLKFGGTRETIMPDPSDEPGRWLYGHMLARWAEAFGREHVHPRIFDRSELAEGSIIEDFRIRWGLGSGYTPVKNANESMQPAAGEVLRRLNAHYPPYIGLKGNPMRGDLGAWVGNGFPGSGPKPSRAEAEAFYRHFEAANEEVRRAWFPERETLFTEDFSAYPETADRPSPGYEDALEVMVEVWRQARERELRLGYDLAVQSGQIAELEGRWDDAIAAYRRALAQDPDRRIARRRLKGAEAAKAQAAAAAEAAARAEAARQRAEAERAARQAAEAEAAVRAEAAAETAAVEAAKARAEIAARWAAQDRNDALLAQLRKRLSLNGIRRLFGVAPR